MYTGEKVRLRECRREDAPKAQAYINDPEMKRLLGGTPFPLTLWDEEKFIAQILSDSHYIGGCGINELDWKNRVVEIGIFIGDKTYWDRGYGTDAPKVYERVGFQEEGRLRQERYVDGAYYDLIIMGLLKEEYEEAMKESK